MKKSIILLFSIILITGCSIEKIDISNYEEIINLIHVDKLNHNVDRIGYSYYKPIDVSIVHNNNANDELHYLGESLYLYVDLTGYYQKSEFKYVENEKIKYSSTFEYNDKKGYIQIKKKQGKYYIVFSYNYSTIEGIVKKHNLNNIIEKVSCILLSVKYNDEVIEKINFTNSNKGTVEKFKLFEELDENEENQFLDYNPENNNNYDYEELMDLK
ncbi:MAG: hypothetical protein ACK5HL_03895 [Bacilli bacterium]